MGCVSGGKAAEPGASRPQGNGNWGAPLTAPEGKCPGNPRPHGPSPPGPARPPAAGVFPSKMARSHGLVAPKHPMVGWPRVTTVPDTRVGSEGGTASGPALEGGAGLRKQVSEGRRGPPVLTAAQLKDGPLGGGCHAPVQEPTCHLGEGTTLPGSESPTTSGRLALCLLMVAQTGHHPVLLTTPWGQKPSRSPLALGCHFC